MSRWDRLLAFTACNLGAAACFVLCFFMFPVLSLRPRKFAVLYVLHFLFVFCFLLSFFSALHSSLSIPHSHMANYEG